MLESLLDHFGLGVAQEDVALALVAARGRLPDLGELYVSHQLSQFPPRLFEPVNRHDPAAALPAEERGARGVTTLGRLELAVDHHARPRVEEVYVVCARDERRDLRPRRPRSDLRDGNG